jgi:hypothetical protein
MKRVTFALLAAVLTMVIANQARATVTWSFFETGISCFSGLSCTLPPQPFVLMTLTLPGPISQGTAHWFGRDARDPPPVYTGDDFIFSFDFGLYRLTPAFNGDQGGFACGSSIARLTICDFDISWSAAASELSIAITFDAVFDNIFRFRNNRGFVATDTEGLGGCTINNGSCEITGFWQSNLAVPEPSSATLVLAGLFGAWFGKRYRRLGPN